MKKNQKEKCKNKKGLSKIKKAILKKKKNLILISKFKSQQIPN